LQAASGDFDIYPSSFDDLDGGLTSADGGVPTTAAAKGLRLGVLWPLLRRVGVIGTTGAGTYLGYRGCKIAYKTLRKAHMQWKQDQVARGKNRPAPSTPSSKSSSKPPSDALVEQAAGGSCESGSSAVAAAAAAAGAFNATAIDELKKEQEELWRFLHSLFKSQDGIITRLDKLAKGDEEAANGSTPAAGAAAAAVAEATAAMDSALRDLGGRLEASLASLAARVDALSAQVAASEGAVATLQGAAATAATNTTATGPSPDAVKQLVRSETQELAEGLQALRRDVKAQIVKALKDHDDTVVDRIRVFGDEMKKLVKGSIGGASGGGKKGSR